MDIEYTLEHLEFEWNEEKAQTNLKKHRVSFEAAAEIFLDPFHVLGDASANQEQREFALGYTLSDQLLLVVYIERRPRIRILSARTATRKEQALYEQTQ